MIQLTENEWLFTTRYNVFKSNETYTNAKAISFPQNPKYINKLIKHDNSIYALLSTGLLFKSNINQNNLIWEKIILPNAYETFDLNITNNTLILLTNTGLFSSNINNINWKKIIKNKSKPELYDQIQKLHTGYTFNALLKPINTIASICLLFLIFFRNISFY